MIITDLEYGKPITQKVVLGGVAEQNSALVMSLLYSPDQSTLLASGMAASSGSARGLNSAVIESFAFTSTYSTPNGFGSESSSGSSSSAASQP